MNMRRFLLISHLKIHNANAMSSPYSIGFPAMTAWLGAMHALQRHLHQQGLNEIELNAVAVSCHQFDLKVYKGPGDFVHSIVGTANPLDKDGSRPAFVEEARCHLEVSLWVEFHGLDSDDHDRFKNLVDTQLQRMKWASGDVLTVKPVEILQIDEDNEHETRKALNRLMLGYVLIERRDLMLKTMQEENKDALDALLDHLKIMHRSTQDENGKVTWSSRRKIPGWLVPIAVGFQGISELGIARNQRDRDTLHRFAESVVTLGEFKMPYRITKLDDMLWQYRVVPEQNLYLCQTLSSTYGD
ncbi:CRISPR type I-F system protein Csy2 [Nitrosomonas sp. PY1]|uniref:type I-F CRISPR-associated protein Csy2 n=1 Tax=Nitrosomonas sp. PY1 TaxID=1803906 RepID=UPI001FC8E41A|nr:type I-F CRISPR-associated protein Csy2 [Nitrosomonas sp. PY1]GKS68081.1 CRISPR type I-F system protein Csy2 [Nitrosomonas sp. PY1]